MENTIKLLDHGFVTLRNISGPTRRCGPLVGDDDGRIELEDVPWFDADDTDPANTARMSFNQTDSGRTRNHSHAQVESQAYAKAIDSLLRQYLPNSMDLYDKYRRMP